MYGFTKQSKVVVNEYVPPRPLPPPAPPPIVAPSPAPVVPATVRVRRVDEAGFLPAKKPAKKAAPPHEAPAKKAAPPVVDEAQARRVAAAAFELWRASQRATSVAFEALGRLATVLGPAAEYAHKRAASERLANGAQCPVAAGAAVAAALATVGEHLEQFLPRERGAPLRRGGSYEPRDDDYSVEASLYRARMRRGPVMLRPGHAQRGMTHGDQTVARYGAR